MDRRRLVFVGVTSAILALLVTGRFRLPAEDIGSTFFDDFFYYAVISRNWLELGFPTFDGQVWTNGVQPLWMGIVLAVMAVFGQGWAFFAVMSVIPLACGVAVADRLWALGERLAVPLDLRAFLAFLAAFWTVTLSSSGMEVCVAIALLLAALLASRPVVVGLLAGLAVLGRIDAIVIVLPFLASHPDRRDARLWAGMTLPAAYALVNKAIFGTFLPISGAAKQLGGPHVPTWDAIAALWTFDGLGRVLVTVSAGLGVAGALLAWRRRERTAAILGVAWAWFYAVQLVMTDWQLWFWYAWPLVVALGVGGMYVAAREWELVPRVFLRTGLLLWTTWAVVYAGVRFASPTPASANPIWVLAQKLTALRLEGRVAMGDRAASYAWLSRKEVVQTEGLVMDAAFLDAIRSGEPFAALMHAGRATTYVGRLELHSGVARSWDKAPESVSQYWDYREPAKAGPRSPAWDVRIEGTPMESVVVADGTWQVWPVADLPTR